MPPSDNAAIRDLANAATLRIDIAEERAEKLEDRVRALERIADRNDGTYAVWNKVQPWASTAIAIAALAKGLGWI
jgi:hypothetical protein